MEFEDEPMESDDDEQDESDKDKDFHNSTTM